MTALLLSPHNDDETLFASFLAIQHRADIVTCLRSQVQYVRYSIRASDRERETIEAVETLGLRRPIQWPFLDDSPDWQAIEQEMRALDVPSVFAVPYDRVFAPALEDDGHEHHNRIGALALEVFGPDRVTHYLTYTRSGGRSRNGVEVVPEPDWIERKHRALACYRSQIAEPSCREHFLRDIREYVVES